MKVRVHKNLHNGLWAITIKGKIAGYCESCELSNVIIKIDEGCRERNLNRPGKAPKRSVHLWAEGELINVSGYQAKNLDTLDYCGLELSPTTREIKYNPHKNLTMIYADNDTPCHATHTARFTLDGKMLGM
jgi:hypothetical protein